MRSYNTSRGRKSLQVTKTHHRLAGSLALDSGVSLTQRGNSPFQLILFRTKRVQGVLDGLQLGTAGRRRFSARECNATSRSLVEALNRAALY